MKGKLIAACCVLLLFLPTYIAVAYYISVQSAPVDINAVNKMQLTDTNGKLYTFEKRSVSSKGGDYIPLTESMIGFFMDLNAASKPETTLPAPLIGEPFFEAKYFSYDRQSVYRYYFSTNPKEAYYVDSAGAAFKIPEEFAGEFILSRYALSLYPASAEPILTIAGQSLLPDSMGWRYINYKGEYSSTSPTIRSAAAVPTIKLVGGALNLLFDVEPDFLLVKIVGDGEEIFNDQYENIGTVNLNENTTVNVTLDARWYDSLERGSGGEASYSFYAQVQAQPAFYLAKTTVEPGDFVLLTGKNIDDINDITITSVPDIEYTPVFFQDDKYVRAFIPIKYDLDEILRMETNKVDGEVLPITFTITSAGVSQEVTLNVSEKKFRVQDYPIGADVIAMKRTPTSLAAFEKAMEPTYTSKENERYFDGLFIPPNTANMIKTGFGIYRTLTATGEKYRHQGVDYIVKATDMVLAVNAGKVIYVGEQILSGKIVVIDHGWGLKSTYCHMSSVMVREGDIVSTGSELGIVGSTGFTDDMRLHCTVSVFTVPVSPYPLESEGVLTVDP